MPRVATVSALDDVRTVTGGPLARERRLGRLQRGTVVAVDGPPGAGATSLVLQLVAEATAAGEWAAAVDPEGTLGGLAALEAGVAPDRFMVVRSGAQWPKVVAALLEGVALVVAEVPTRLPAGDARRLVARARERGSVLVALGPWPERAALRLSLGRSPWTGLGWGEGLLGRRDLRLAGEESSRKLGATSVAPGGGVEAPADAVMSRQAKSDQPGDFLTGMAASVVTAAVS